MTDLRERLLERCGLPADCGWTDDQLFDHIDLGLRGNTRTEPGEDTAEAREWAQRRDLAWAVNVHSLDAMSGIPDHMLSRVILGVVKTLAEADVAHAADFHPPRLAVNP